jgi:molybdopterin converting factor small subunit
MCGVEVMPKVHVKFLAAIKEAIGKDSIDINIEENETIKSLLKNICNQFGKQLCMLFLKKTIYFQKIS